MEVVPQTNKPDNMEQESTEELVEVFKQEVIDQRTSEDLLVVSKQKIIKNAIDKTKLYNWSPSMRDPAVYAHPCKQCSRRFESMKILRAHSQLHHATGKFPANCPLCELVFHSGEYLPRYLESNFRIHIKLHTKQFIEEYRKANYSCKVCGREFNTAKIFESHKRSHNRRPPMDKDLEVILQPPIRDSDCTEESEHPTSINWCYCEKCNRKFETPDILEVHSYEHCDRSEIPTSCPVCDFIFGCRPNLTHREVADYYAHMKLHTRCRRNEFRAQWKTCSECGKVLSNSKELTLHKRRAHNSFPYSCTRCDKFFKNDKDLQKHTKSKHMLFKCKICNKATYKLKKKAREHLEECSWPYSILKKPPPPTHIVKCDFCEIWFRSPDALAEHTKNNHFKKCPICEIGFSTPEALAEHTKNNHSKKKCPICSQMILPSSWNEHVQQHDKARYQCKLCGLEFRKICDRDDHLREHMGYTALELAEAKITKTFPCKICNEKSFDEKAKLCSHIVIHMEKCICCTCCGKRFSYFRYQEHQRKKDRNEHRRLKDQYDLNGQNSNIENTIQETESNVDPLALETSTCQSESEITIKMENIDYPDPLEVKTEPPMFVEIKEEPIDETAMECSSDFLN